VVARFHPFSIGLAGLALLSPWSALAQTDVVVELPRDALYLPGRYVYQRNCIVCHGRYGDGRGEIAVEMFPKPRPFTSGIFKYRSTPSGFLPTNEDLLRTVRGGLVGTSMPAFTLLSDRDLRAVIEYIKSFSSKWRKPENYAAPLRQPPVPSWFEKEPELRRHAARGGELFSVACAVCHGTAGDGDGPAAEGLLDAWDQPCRPADLRGPLLRSGPKLTDAYRAIVTGISATPMPSFEETLTEDQRWDLVAYIGVLREGDGLNSPGEK